MIKRKVKDESRNGPGAATVKRANPDTHQSLATLPSQSELTWDPGGSAETDEPTGSTGNPGCGAGEQEPRLE